MEPSQKKAAYSVPSKFGICFTGSEESFCCALDLAIASHQSARVFPDFTYCEIGFAAGDTVAAVDQYLRQWKIDFQIIGVDLAANIHGDTIRRFQQMGADAYLWGAANFFKDFVGALFDFIFIDACHGKDCVKRDFLGAEKMVKAGGVIAFHDTDPQAQGHHAQPHCNQPIGVRAAMADLGLLSGVREGWTIIDETLGELRTVGGCIFLQRQ